MSKPLMWYVGSRADENGTYLWSGDAVLDYEIHTDDQITYKLFVITDHPADTFMAHKGSLIECQIYAQDYSESS
jgi:hypothetical protein